MRSLMQHRALRFIFAANLISMIGSGMNHSAVIWFILQATHSEVALGTLVILGTAPALLMLPFTGVVIDREDRRRLVMLLDGGRGLVILAVAMVALRGQAQLWQLYAMSTLVSAGFWMFWPTVTALIQEITPPEKFVESNTFLMAGVQGGWLLAGAFVGFVYNHIGLGGVLLIDVATYAVSFLCYFLARRGRHVVRALQSADPDEAQTAEPGGAWARYLREIRQGLSYLKTKPDVVMIGLGWALFLSAMLTQGIVTAPLSDRILSTGAVGFGWLNGAWGMGAFFSALYSAILLARFPSRRVVGVAMGALSAGMFLAPHSPRLAVAVLLYAVMGSARGLGGIAISSSLMELVPKHFMGRVQNTFFFLGTALQVVLGFAVGAVAHRVGLVYAFAIIGAVYLVACITTTLPVASSPLVAVSEND